MGVLNQATSIALRWLPLAVQRLVRQRMTASRDRAAANALKRAGIFGLAQHDINHVLHHLRGLELKGLPKGVETFISVGCAGTWYFRWIEENCGPISRHIGIEFYMPKPDDLPSNVEWIANTAGDMSSISDGMADIVFSGQNIEHLWPSEVACFLKESHRVLKEGGLLVIDSPNRRVTSQLGWSHPEHTIEFTPDEARELIECSGFEVAALRGMWLCVDPARGESLRFDEIQGRGRWPLARRVAEAQARPKEAFSWWIEARKIRRSPDTARVDAAIHKVFQSVWPERVNRLLTLVGEPFTFDGHSWFRATKGPGVLMYGPYMPLPSGEYTVRFHLRCVGPLTEKLNDIVRLDVVAGDGKELAMLSICGNQFDDSDSLTPLLTFRLAAMTFGIQFRIIVNSNESIMVLKAVQLTCHANAELSSSDPSVADCFSQMQ